MKDFKGTKGKWELVANPYYLEVIRASEDDKNVFTAAIHISREKDSKGFESDSLCEENMANAKLISKAPELLEMLQKISLSLEMFSPPTKEIALDWSKEINELIKSTVEWKRS